MPLRQIRRAEFGWAHSQAASGVFLNLIITHWVNGFVVDDNKNLWLSAPCGFCL
jgi:hypothetical protein